MPVIVEEEEDKASEVSSPEIKQIKVEREQMDVSYEMQNNSLLDEPVKSESSLISDHIQSMLNNRPRAGYTHQEAFDIQSDQRNRLNFTLRSPDIQ